MMLLSPTLRQAVAAAQAVAAKHGIADTTPQVLHASGNVWVHLHPYPLVAQVPKDVVAVRGQSALTHLTRDVHVCQYLAGLGVPVGAPSDLLPPGPHEHNGMLVAFYKHYQRASEKNDFAAGRALRLVHEALADYRGPLTNMEAPLHEPRRVIGMLQAGALLSKEHIHLLRTRLDLAEQYMSVWPMQPVHGDVHLQNVAWTSQGPLWTDFEDVCKAPLHWDIAGLVASTQLYGIDAHRLDRALKGYDIKPIANDLKPFVHARVAQITAWAATRAGHDQVARKRLADGMKYLRYHYL
jgi:Phosphotransferase enzyme family